MFQPCFIISCVASLVCPLLLPFLFIAPLYGSRYASLNFDQQLNGWMNSQSKHSFRVWTVHYRSLSELFLLESACSGCTDAGLPVLAIAT